MLNVPGIIAGKEVWGTDTFLSTNPSTGQPFAKIARLGAAEVDEAVASARSAFENTERLRSASSRSELMRELARLIRRDADHLAEMESTDVGKPLRQAKADALVTARYFEYYASVLLSIHGDTLPMMDNTMAFTQREAFGVTAHITPWNYPLQMSARTLAPSVAAGNCCVLKPAEDTPTTAVEIARLALEAGFPPGVVNVVTGLGSEAGAALSAHPGIDHISFTGSRPVGTMIAEAAAKNVIPAVLELGGKSPNIVFDDADLDRSVPLIANAITQNCGQTCSAGSRLLVHESVHAEVVERVKAIFETMSVGPGLDDADMGPLISAKQRDRVAELVGVGRDEATLVTGGTPPDDSTLDDGFFWRPTLFDDVPQDARIYQEEIFGPVLVVSSFADEADAVAAANSTEYALVAAVWTRDIARAHRVARDVRAGQVFVNTYGAAGGVELPFGGWKGSGYGREKGIEGLLGYTQTKTVVVGL